MKKLDLNKETLRTLSDLQAGDVQGAISALASVGCTGGAICTVAITSYVQSCSLCTSVVIECHTGA